MPLSHSQARKFYDHFGSKQDTQSFYEDAAIDDLLAHSAIDRAEHVFEFGCGTGRFALNLLEKHLSASASYYGIDISQTMIGLAGQRIAPYRDRAQVLLSDGTIHFPIADHSVDRVISTYVLDLLSESDIREAVSEARRVLMSDGKLCLVSLTTGHSLPSRLVSTIWSGLCRLYAPIVGGCRPVQLTTHLDNRCWSIEYHNTISQFGITSEVLVAMPK